MQRAYDKAQILMPIVTARQGEADNYKLSVEKIESFN